MIDLTIALESTLLAGLRDELKYRLALRGAALLAGMRDPTEVYGLLRAIYDIRSAVVHDGILLSEITKGDLWKCVQALKPKPIAPLDLPDYCEDITRLILREYLKRLAAERSLENINCELESTVLHGLNANE